MKTPELGNADTELVLTHIPTGASPEVTEDFSKTFGELLSRYGAPTIYTSTEASANHGLGLMMGTGSENLVVFRPYDRGFVSATITTRENGDANITAKDSVRALLLDSDGNLLTSQSEDSKNISRLPVTGNVAVKSFLYESIGIVKEHSSLGLRLRSLGRRAIMPGSTHAR